MSDQLGNGGSPRNPSKSYRAEVDLLRVIAVGVVVLFHAELGFSGGYVGVDVFFVISGFLIIRAIFSDSRNAQFSLAEFFRRRIRRLAPASLAMIAITLTAGLLLLDPKSLRSLGTSAVANQFFIQNFLFSRHTDYFGTAADLMPLLHTWSLAVEEQFYLLVPIAAIFLRGSRRNWLGFLALIILVSFSTSVFLTPTHPQEAFFFLPTRA